MDSDLQNPDPFRALGLEASASTDEVKRAYRRLLKLYRPEQNPEEFQQLRAVYVRALQITKSEDAGQKLDSHRYRASSITPEDVSALIDAAHRAAHTPLPSELRISDEHVQARVSQRASAEVEAMLKEGDVRAAIERLRSLQKKWEPRDPEGWSFWLTQLARPRLFTQPEVAEQLLDQTAAADIPPGWLFDRIEEMRAQLPMAAEVEGALKDELIPTALVEFIGRNSLEPSDSAKEDVVALYEGIASQTWAPEPTFSRMKSRFPELYRSWRRVAAGLADQVQKARSTMVEDPSPEPIEDASLSGLELEMRDLALTLKPLSFRVVLLLGAAIIGAAAAAHWGSQSWWWFGVCLMFVGCILLWRALLGRQCVETVRNLINLSSVPVHSLLTFMEKRDVGGAKRLHDSLLGGFAGDRFLLENLAYAIRAEDTNHSADSST